MRRGHGRRQKLALVQLARVRCLALGEGKVRAARRNKTTGSPSKRCLASKRHCSQHAQAEPAALGCDLAEDRTCKKQIKPNLPVDRRVETGKVAVDERLDRGAVRVAVSFPHSAEWPWKRRKRRAPCAAPGVEKRTEGVDSVRAQGAATSGHARRHARRHLPKHAGRPARLDRHLGKAPQHGE